MCEHKNLRTVGHRLFCTDCGAELPIEFLTGEKKKEPTKKRPAKKKETIGYK